MDVGVVTTTTRYSSSSSSSSSNNSNSNSQNNTDKATLLNCGGGGGSSGRNGKQQQQQQQQQQQSPATPNKHVNFTGPSEEKKREKFLTAKYGAHQMALIRKRLRVEMWMYERLQELYGADDIEIDLDEVLDMDNEIERRQYISNLLKQIEIAPGESVNIFVGDLLEKVKTL